MFELEKLVRPNILSLQPYSSARDEFENTGGVFLDANENPYGNLNRYPDPHQMMLKNALSQHKNVPVEQMFIGNGSDEVIDLAFRIFCIPNEDSVIICPPTYGMYQVLANLNDTGVININLLKNFELDIDKIMQQNAKMLFICSPNNPTGNILRNVEFIIQNFKGIVFVDEAYIDFSSQISLLNKINEYPNLIVSQTFSKAFGLAAARVGIAYASRQIIALYNKIKSPYNVSVLNQKAALQALINLSSINENITIIVSQKEYLVKALLQLNIVKEIYPSDANFLLVKMANADFVYRHLLSKRIITRNRNNMINNCIRITIGTPEENRQLIYILKQISK